MSNSFDNVQRFIFDHLDARGAVVRLTESCEMIQSTHHYPKPLAKVLNQFAGAVCLLSDSIKIDGSVTLQLRTQGAVSLIMADCVAGEQVESCVRAIAEYDAQEFPASEEFSFSDLTDGATMAITISPAGGERYQGIVPIECASLEACLEDYFTRSEQLPTKFRLMADESKVIAMALHALPQQKQHSLEDSKASFEQLSAYLKTMQFAEAEQLNNEQMLTRLFHQDECRLFEDQPLKFGCQCSASRSLAAIVSLGVSEVNDMISEQREQGSDALVVDCHFCFQRYEIPSSDVEAALLEV